MIRMESLSLTDEVRFCTSPDIVDDENTRKSYSWTRFSDYRQQKSMTNNDKQQRSRPQAIINTDGLIELDLSRRSLANIPTEVYTMLRIEALKINNNRIENISSNISNLHKLRVLHAQHNQITFIHETIANCIHLQHLDLSDNRLTLIPRSIGLLRGLKVFKLTNNELEMLPNEIGDMSSLEQLELGGNKLWHLPATFSKLQNIRHLNLSRNKFDQLPVCVCCMKRIEALDMHGNDVHNLPLDFSNLKCLEELSLATNQLQSLPQAIFTLRHLHSLDVSYNQLHSVPHRLAQLPALRMLIIQGNQLVSLPTNLDTLHYLNIAKNKFQNFSVVHMRQLRYLNASHNGLENMPLGVYNLIYLEILKLNNNNISYLSQDIILLKRLRVLDMAYNKLTSLPHVIDELTKLEVFNIKGNRITDRSLPAASQTTEPKPAGNSTGQAVPAAQMLGGNPRHAAKPMSSLKVLKGYQRQERPDGTLKGYSNQRQANTQPQAAATPKHYRKRHSFRRRGVPVYRSQQKRKSMKAKNRPAQKHLFSTNSTKNAGTQHGPKYEQAATQYTPRSTIRSHDRPPLERIHSTPASIGSKHQNGIVPNHSGTLPASANLPTSIHHSLESLNISKLPHTTANDPFSVSEISYPMVNTPVRNEVASSSNVKKSTHALTPRKLASESYTQHWVDEKSYDCASDSSNSVTINEPIGDNLSLGDDDFEFVPTNIPDKKLLRLCHEAESLLNTELLRPLQINKGIFKKSLNEDGTLRTLHGITGENSITVHSELDTDEQNDGIIYMTKDIFLKRPTDIGDNGILRLKMDMFTVTPSGGLFKSSVDPNTSIYFPMNAIKKTINVTLQIERINPEALLSAKKLYRSVHTLLSVGDIVHVTQSKDLQFQQQVTITIPSPALLHHGNLHLITYRDNNTCLPCLSSYQIHNGYISLQVWHFSGRGAILTKTKDKHRACRAMEDLLQHLYI